MTNLTIPQADKPTETPLCGFKRQLGNVSRCRLQPHNITDIAGRPAFGKLLLPPVRVKPFPAPIPSLELPNCRINMGLRASSAG